MTHIMDFTTEDLAAGILGSTGPYRESLKRATNAINSAIAAAVQAERNELEAVVHRTIMANTLATYNERCTIDDEVHAAICARSNGNGSK